MSFERISISVTRRVDFKKSLSMTVAINAPLDKENIGMVTNLLENTIEIVSRWKGSGGGDY